VVIRAARACFYRGSTSELAAIGGWLSGRASNTNISNTTDNNTTNTNNTNPNSAVSRFLSAAVSRGANGSCSGAGANYEPEGVATQTLPEGAAFCGGDCGVAFLGNGGEFRGVIGRILFGGG
jgi:hypothetical protein